MWEYVTVCRWELRDVTNNRQMIPDVWVLMHGHVRKISKNHVEFWHKLETMGHVANPMVSLLKQTILVYDWNLSVRETWLESTSHLRHNLQKWIGIQTEFSNISRNVASRPLVITSSAANRHQSRDSEYNWSLPLVSMMVPNFKPPPSRTDSKAHGFSRDFVGELFFLGMHPIGETRHPWFQIPWKCSSMDVYPFWGAVYTLSHWDIRIQNGSKQGHSCSKALQCV